MISQRRLLVIAASFVVLAASCTETGQITSSHTASTSSSPTTSTAPAPATTPASAGSDGLGDRLYPTGGNGGYDVTHYDVNVDATAPAAGDAGRTVSIVTTITATSTQSLSTFNLDLHGMELGDVTVDGADATTARNGDELTVTPSAALGSGETFTTVVSTSGVPQPVPDVLFDDEQLGWRTAQGNSYVVSEPIGAKSFLASNDHPSDKATFTFHITTTPDTTAIANGTLTSSVTTGVTRTWTYDMVDPMATYLVQIAIGEYDVIDGGRVAVGSTTIPVRSAVVSPLPKNARVALGKIPEIIEFYQRRFGPYPFKSVGVLIADSPPSFALETQTIPILPALWFTGTTMTPAEAVTIMAHELSHQWFGDSVALAEWSDMWLNEGFATWAEWWWAEHHGGPTLAVKVRDAMASASELRSTFGEVLSPRAGELFSPNQYDGAALAVEALRRTVGDDVFNSILLAWQQRFGGRSVRSGDFEALAGELSGRDLSAFFNGWLRSTDVPKMPAPIGDGTVR